MALENLQSKFGPFNKKGQPGTGEVVDLMAFEGKKNKGVEGKQSKYGGSEKIGIPPTVPDVLGNIPAERSFE